MATEQEIKAFWKAYVPYAVQVNELDPRIFPETALVQWAVETSYGTSELCLKDFNLAGISTGDGKTFLRFISLEEFVKYYVTELHLKYYTNVLDQRNATDQMTELGLSPWAASHYKYEGDSGEELTSIYKSNLTEISKSIDDQITKIKLEKSGLAHQKTTEFWVQSGGFSDRANAQLIIDFCTQHGWWAGLYERV